MFWPNLGPSSVVNQTIHSIVTYIYKQRGEGEAGKHVGGNKIWVKIEVAVWVCVYKSE